MKQFLLLLLVLPVMAMAASPFDGTWKAELNTAKLPDKPSVILLKKGIYECKSCVPALYISANGSDQAVTGNPYYDSIAVRIVNDHRLDTTYKMAGKIVSQSNISVAADGKTATILNESRYGAKPVTGTTRLTRVAAGPDGAHAYSGSWRTTAYEDVSQNGLLMTLRLSADSLQLNDTNGMSYDARFDGKEYPIVGDPAHTTVMLKRVDARTIEETDKIAGKLESVSRMIIAADGKSLETVYDDKRRGTSTRYTWNRQK
jgi:hypothetical protein